MTNSRVAVLTGGAALLAAWLSSAASTMPSAPLTDSPVDVGTMPAQAVTPTSTRPDLEREVERLVFRFENGPRPHYPARNPFTLLASTRATSPLLSAPGATPRPVPGPVVSVAAGPPPVSLAGIAVERIADGLRRTAILSAEGRVFLARIGDEVMDRFEVRAVTDDAVELFDLRDGTPLRLILP